MADEPVAGNGSQLAGARVPATTMAIQWQRRRDTRRGSDNWQFQQWYTEPGETFPVIDPANDPQPDLAPQASREDVDRAVESVREVQQAMTQ